MKREEIAGITFLSILMLVALLASLSVSALPSIDNCNSTSGIVVNASSEMNNSIKSNGTCITIGADNVTFDCSGFTLTFGINLTQDGEFPASGINISNRNNVTIRSCTIVLGDQNSNATGMMGLNITNSTNVTILNTTITVNASAGNNRGILVQNSSRTRMDGIQATVRNGSSNYGIYFLGSTNNTISTANVTVNGSTLSDGIRLEAVSSISNINNTNITVNGSQSFAFHVQNSNSTVLNNTLISRMPGTTGDWMNFSTNAVSTLRNTTFWMPNGSINFRGEVAVSIPLEINNITLNISPNRAYVNTSNLTMFNTSARISLFNIYDVDAAPTVNFSDNKGGSGFSFCPNQGTSTICTKISYNGSGDNTLVFDTTRFSTFSSMQGNANVTLSKTDSVDPVTSGNNVAYSINITNNGTTNVSNLSLTDLYPVQLRFLNSSILNESGGNNTFIIGNLTAGQSLILTITLRAVENIPSPNVVANNTVNITYQNSSGTSLIFNVTENTTVNAAATLSGGSVSGGGGGGGGGAGTTRSMTTDSAQFVTRRSDRVNLNVNNILHTITVLQIYTDKVLIRAASTPQEFVIAAGKSQLIDFEKDGVLDVRVTVVSISYNQATLKIEKLISSCVESWTCEAWSACENSQQSRSCVDLNNCGSTKNKPSESQSCTAAATEPAPAVPETAPEAPETPVEEESEEAPITEEYLDTSDMLTKLFYGLAILALVVFCAYWYYARKNK